MISVKLCRHPASPGSTLITQMAVIITNQNNNLTTVDDKQNDKRINMTNLIHIHIYRSLHSQQKKTTFAVTFLLGNFYISKEFTVFYFKHRQKCI